ncbi:MAG TPA: hypothetical protein VK470_14520 [Bacteroidota bacterium]|nr:hypothetical protein [Bacteroidota bacterium]
MVIEYLTPLSRAWGRTKNMLFHPFDIGKWFALGFSAFLAGLTDWPGGGGGGGGRGPAGNFDIRHAVDWDYVFDFPNQVSLWIAEHHFWVLIIIASLLFILVLSVVLTWLSSRGIFMFLDNVVHNRSRIGQPWREFKGHGESIFLWRLALGFLSVVMFLELVVAAFFIARTIYFRGDPLSSFIALWTGFALIGFVFFLVVHFISRMLTDFIAPIMYKENVSVLDAWRKFLVLFPDHIWDMILYYFFIIGLYILVAIGVVIIGVVTCCCGFILLAIPYIGSVVLLPVSVTFRTLSLEFLAQFGEQYTVIPSDPSASAAAETITPII